MKSKNSKKPQKRKTVLEKANIILFTLAKTSKIPFLMKRFYSKYKSDLLLKFRVISLNKCFDKINEKFQQSVDHLYQSFGKNDIPNHLNFTYFIN